MTTRSILAFGTLWAIAVSCSTGPDEDAARDDYRAPEVQREPVVIGYAAPAAAVPSPHTGAPYRAEPPRWPEAASATIALAAQAVAHPAMIGGLPVRLAPLDGSERAAGSVFVETWGHDAARAAGVEGVVLAIAATDARALRLEVDYRAFRGAHGGDWASRLALWSLSCTDAGCEAARLPSSNHAGAGTVSAAIRVPARDAGDALIMLAAAPAGGGGDYQATSLASAATWSAGNSTGDLTWSYPLRVPPAIGGAPPVVTFAYSSSAVDGRMASTNNQASWIGDGFDWQPGSIERRYRGCAKDMANGANNTVKTGDLCWATENATLSLAGHAGELIKDGANLWHLRGDDGTRIEHRTGGPNGDNDGEWWLATTTDGTQYWFGGRAGSNGVLTVPVFGNHGGEPCHQTAFKDSSCTQGYRWMLDRVIDPLGNTIAYSYAKETNKYGKNNKPEDDTVYDRDGYLTKIEYGTHADVASAAPLQVVFGVADRCLAGCATKDAQHWPDVPWDLECTAATCSPSQGSPSFWSTKRLASVTTQIRGGASVRDVETWTLTHSFPSSDQPTLWLDKISHHGLVGGDVVVPDIQFVGVVLPNRVDTDNDQYPGMNRYRMKTINSESGGKLDISYAPADCIKGTRVPSQTALENNALRCYPVRWTPEGKSDPINDFFHKYVVSDVVEADLFGSSTRVVTHYDYLGAPAWHYTDDDGLIDADLKTWSVWRGYAAVRVTRGDPGEQLVEEHRFFRGMHGDHLPSGTRSVVLPAIAIGNVPASNDEDAFAGQTRESITFEGANELSAKVSEPWQSAPTASRTIAGTTVHARRVGVAVTHTRTTLDGGRAPRTTTATTTFDSEGMPAQVDDRGDDAATGDERCTLTDYVRNPNAGILDKPARVRNFAVGCAQVGAATELDAIDDTRTSYDGQAWNVAPTRGNPTKIETLAAFAGGAASHVVEKSYGYDAYGRRTQATDIRGNTTTTTYQPATGDPAVASVETTQLGWVTTTTREPAWGVPLSTTDLNGRRLDFAYDAMGRLTDVWLPGRDRGAATPSIKYTYLLRNDAPTVIQTQRVNANGGYLTTYQLYDSLMRDRQTQAMDEAGGTSAVITDTYYDSAGRPVKLHDRYLAVDAALHPVAPSTALFLPMQNIPRFTVKQYDGAGREIAAIAKVDGPPASAGGTELWRTTTSYAGDRVDVTPPAGGTAMSKILDARGNVIELRHYQAGHAAGSATGFDRMTYAYQRDGQLARVTDNAGNAWRFRYDLRGHRLEEVDPDKGTTTMTYTAAGDLETSRDARGAAVAYTYDALGRKTSLRDGAVAGPKRVEWTYDTLSNGAQVYGQLTKVTRYVGNDAFVEDHLGFTADYKPVSVKYTVPDSVAAPGIAGSYTYTYTYAQDGATATTRLPGFGDLGQETLTHGYNALAKPTSLATSLGATLVAAPDAMTPATQYTSLGELAAIHLRNNAGPRVDITRTYDIATRRLAQIWTTRATGTTTVADVRYGYDPMGNVTKIDDLTAADHQCFEHDYLQRIAEAWTPSDGDCGKARSSAALGGPAKYWHSYSYDALGNRTHLKEHSTAGDRDTSYVVPGGAHRLTSTSVVDGTGTHAASYGYDLAGNVQSRPTLDAGAQTLSWDVEGRLATSQDNTGATTFIYDAQGNRLVRRDPTGTTLYLPNQELRYRSADGAKQTTRYYTHLGQVIATRTAAGLTWMAADHHGTARATIAAVDQAVAARRETPFGTTRGTTGTWPAAMERDFVGGTRDSTGLVHLGAREYDPVIGRFLSVDAKIDVDDPQQMQGYAYANNSPISASDANGLFPSFGNLIGSVINHAIKAYNSHGSGLARGLISFGLRALRPTTSHVPGWSQPPEIQLQGEVLGLVQNDPAMVDYQKRYEQYVADEIAKHGYTGPGVYEIESPKEEYLGFGGERAPDNMWDQAKHFWRPEYRPTWGVGANPTTWMLRHAKTTAKTTVYYGNSPKDTYTVTTYTVEDTLDLRPHNHDKHDFGLLRNPAKDPYDAATVVLGTVWHDLTGHSDQTKVTATWTVPSGNARRLK